MRPEATGLAIRAAGAADAAGLAALHARSWRATYRGSLSDAYLDGPVEAERHSFWTRRLADPPDHLVTLLADRPGEMPAGFVCAEAEADARWGTLVDNLHVAPEAKRAGLGRALMGALGAALAARGTRGPVHLFVMQANAPALAFYRRLGASAVEDTTHREPDGSVVGVFRMAWSDVATFCRAVAGSAP